MYIKEKISTVFLGILLGFCLIEILLRMGGAALLLSQEWKNNKSLDVDSVKVLCLGESTTFLGKRNDYPNFLEIYLNNSSLPYQFKVINLGIPAISTGRILENVPKYLKRYNPDIVVSMIGINDEIYGHDYVPSFNNGAFEDKRLIQHQTTILDQFVKFKFYKLVMWLSEAMYSATKQIGARIKVASLKRDIRLDTKNANLYIELGQLYHYELQNHAKAEIMFKKAIELNPNNAEAFYLLGQLYHYWKNEDSLDIQMLERSIALDPKLIKSYMELVTAYSRKEDQQGIKRTYQKAITYNPNIDWGYAGLSSIYRRAGQYDLMYKYEEKALEKRLQNGRSATTQNYQLLNEILKQKGIQLIAVQYPMRNVLSLKEVLGENSGALFVDNEEAFKHAVGQIHYEEYFIDQFAGDFGHATTKGNKLLASNIFKVVEAYYRELF